MMQTFIKKSSLILLSGTVLAACGDGTEAETSSQGSEAAETEAVQMLTSVTGGKNAEEMTLFEEKLSELSGYPIEMEKPASDYNTVLLQKLRVGGEGLDLIYFDQSQMYDLIEQGALLDITEYVENSDILSNNVPQEEWEGIEVDGSYYAGFNKQEVHRVVNMNQAILDEHGLELEEESLDGYYQLFQDMKDSVDNSNFYPLNAVISDVWDIQPWMAAEGLLSGIVEDENGNKTVPYASDESVVVWEWLATLFEEGLPDPSSLTDDSTAMRNKFQSGDTGVVVDWIAWTGLYNANAQDDYPENFNAVPHGGVQTSEGDYILSKGAASLWGIPATSDNVEGAISVLETFATQEGGELLSIGIEGHDYELENDEVVLTDVGEDHGSDHGAPFPIYQDFEMPVEHNPGVEAGLEFFEYAEVPSMGPETNEANEIIAEHAILILQGDVTPEEGVENMQNDLRSSGIID